jgi:hypothetical protein
MLFAKLNQQQVLLLVGVFTPILLQAYLLHKQATPITDRFLS